MKTQQLPEEQLQGSIQQRLQQIHLHQQGIVHEADNQQEHALEAAVEAPSSSEQDHKPSSTEKKSGGRRQEKPPFSYIALIGEYW